MFTFCYLHKTSAILCSKISKAVSDYIRRLKRAFQVAYGHEKLITETWDALLYRVKLESSAVSGSLT